jgi:vWA found in TerF C terminus
MRQGKITDDNPHPESLGWHWYPPGNLLFTKNFYWSACTYRTPMSILMNRDYTLILDKSGSMSTTDQGGKSRWVYAQESTLALARKCEQLDPDGITVYAFSGRFKRYDNVTSSRVDQIFMENDPIGTTNLAAVLKDATDQYFQRQAAGEAATNGETILVVTDGEPDDRRAVIEVIINATQKMQRDEELAISFIQVGSDAGATSFLKALDDQLESVGAKFDICDTITIDDMGDMSLADVLMAAIED